VSVILFEVLESIILCIEISIRSKKPQHGKLNNKTRYKRKSAQRRRKHCALAVVSRSQKFSPRRRPPSRSAGDGHYLYLQTQFGEDRCTQYRVIVVTDPPTTHKHTHTHKHTNRQDRLQYTTSQLSAQCNKHNQTRAHTHIIQLNSLDFIVNRFLMKLCTILPFAFLAEMTLFIICK